METSRALSPVHIQPFEEAFKGGDTDPSMSMHALLRSQTAAGERAQSTQAGLGELEAVSLILQGLRVNKSLMSEKKSMLKGLVNECVCV